MQREHFEPEIILSNGCWVTFAVSALPLHILNPNNVFFAMILSITQDNHNNKFPQKAATEVAVNTTRTNHNRVELYGKQLKHVLGSRIMLSIYSRP